MNYVTLVANLQSWLEDYGVEFQQAIPEIVRKAEDMIYSAVQIPALRKSTVLIVTAQNRAVTVPTDLLSVSTAAIVDGSGLPTNLLVKDPSYLDEVYPVWAGAVYGLPRVYARSDQGTLILGPVPQNGYVLRLAYFYKPASIVDAGTSWIGDNAESVLHYGCLVEAYTFNKGDDALHARYRARFDEALAMLKLLGEGRAKSDDFRIDRFRS